MRSALATFACPGRTASSTQFAHASSIEIATTDGKLAQYYLGVEYSPKDMLLGLDRGLGQQDWFAGREHSHLLLPL